MHKNLVLLALASVISVAFALGAQAQTWRQQGLRCDPATRIPAAAWVRKCGGSVGRFRMVCPRCNVKERS